MPTLMEERADALKSAEDIVNGAKAAERELTAEETTKANDYLAKVDDLDGKIKAADDGQKLVKRLGEMGQKTAGDNPEDGSDGPLSLGEHFVKHAGAEFKAKRGTSGATVGAPEWIPSAKASSDTQVTSGGGWSGVLTQIDRTIVPAFRPRLVVADLLGTGTMGANTNAITYFVEGAVEGAFTTVAEGAAKPQMHVVDPTTRTDALKKIAAFMNFTDEMGEDLDFYVSELNQRGLYLLGSFEEAQLLSGNGTGTNVDGLTHRSGHQTETAASVTVAGDDNADALFRALTKVATATGLDADGIVINPADYQNLRLNKDGNGQYFGGGYFQGEYGNGQILSQPPVWGRRTVVTPAIAAGTALVGAYSTAATLYRKGGVRVESTNSHASNFTSNIVTTRIEERVALAVRVPAAFVLVTFDNTAPA